MEFQSSIYALSTGWIASGEGPGLYCRSCWCIKFLVWLLEWGIAINCWISRICLHSLQKNNWRNKFGLEYLTSWWTAQVIDLFRGLCLKLDQFNLKLKEHLCLFFFPGRHSSVMEYIWYRVYGLVKSVFAQKIWKLNISRSHWNVVISFPRKENIYTPIPHSVEKYTL